MIDLFILFNILIYSSLIIYTFIKNLNLIENYSCVRDSKNNIYRNEKKINDLMKEYDGYLQQLTPEKIKKKGKDGQEIITKKYQVEKDYGDNIIYKNEKIIADYVKSKEEESKKTASAAESSPLSL